MEMKTMLSMPRTISKTVSVSSAIQISGFETQVQSIVAGEGVRDTRLSQLERADRIDRVRDWHAVGRKCRPQSKFRGRSRKGYCRHNERLSPSFHFPSRSRGSYREDPTLPKGTRAHHRRSHPLDIRGTDPSHPAI